MGANLIGWTLLGSLGNAGDGASHHSRVTVVSDRNTAVRMGHTQLLSCLANRKIQDK